mgnify:CR=1 FL=1
MCCSCGGADSRARHCTGETNGPSLKWQMPPNCHCEERSDVAISGRHSQIVQAAVKTYRPIASVAALTERLVQGYSTAQGHWCTARHPDVSLRGAKRRGNLGKALPIYTECRRTQSLSNLTVAALSERHGGLQYAPHCFYGARLSDLSLRGAKRRGNLTQPVTYSPGLTCYSAYPTSLPQAVFSFPSI